MAVFRKRHSSLSDVKLVGLAVLDWQRGLMYSGGLYMTTVSSLKELGHTILLERIIPEECRLLGCYTAWLL
jgi:hypothetical protein